MINCQDFLYCSPQFVIGLESGSENSDVRTLKCANIIVFHFTCQETVLHQIRSTEISL